jgi:hypothetical protein
LLEESRRLLSFWTISLPGPALRALEGVTDGVARFQDTVRQELERALRRKGLSPEALGVCEIQPSRLKRTGVFAPHWHLVFRGRKSSGHGWALSIAELDHIILLCLKRVCGYGDGVISAGNVQQVRKSVAAYLGRYMKKGLCPQATHMLDQAPDALVPKQWWLMTRPLLKALVTRTFPVNPAFLSFVDCCENTLQQLGFIWASWHLNEDTGIWIKRTAFRDLDALEHCLQLFESEVGLLRDLRGEGARPARWFQTAGAQV